MKKFILKSLLLFTFFPILCFANRIKCEVTYDLHDGEGPYVVTGTGDTFIEAIKNAPAPRCGCDPVKIDCKPVESKNNFSNTFSMLESIDQ